MTSPYFNTVNLVVERVTEEGTKTILKAPFIRIIIDSITELHMKDNQALELCKDIKDALK